MITVQQLVSNEYHYLLCDNVALKLRIDELVLLLEHGVQLHRQERKLTKFLIQGGCLILATKCMLHKAYMSPLQNNLRKKYFYGK